MVLPLLPRLDVEVREVYVRCVGVRCVVSRERVVRDEVDCDVVVLEDDALDEEDFVLYGGLFDMYLWYRRNESGGQGR